jgi:enoyl-CoA hydratase/carnithine racemase
MDDIVLVEDADQTRRLKLNRPDALNALTVEAMRALADHLDDAAADRRIGAVVLTGAGDVFSAGGDLALLLELPRMPPAEAREIVYGSFQRVARVIRGMDKPVIAAVNGAAVGTGCEIAIACDFRIASERARFSEAWIRLGCVPALGGMYLLPRLVGLVRATELVLTGEMIDAREALRIGLVNKVVMPPDLMPAAEELALRLARGPRYAIAAAKAALNRGLHGDFSSELDLALDAQIGCFATRDFAEGVRALAEKRAPRFTGA